VQRRRPAPDQCSADVRLQNAGGGRRIVQEESWSLPDAAAPDGRISRDQVHKRYFHCPGDDGQPATGEHVVRQADAGRFNNAGTVGEADGLRRQDGRDVQGSLERLRCRQGAAECAVKVLRRPAGTVDRDVIDGGIRREAPGLKGGGVDKRLECRTGAPPGDGAVHLPVDGVGRVGRTD